MLYVPVELALNLPLYLPLHLPRHLPWRGHRHALVRPPELLRALGHGRLLGLRECLVLRKCSMLCPLVGSNWGGHAEAVEVGEALQIGRLLGRVMGGVHVGVGALGTGAQTWIRAPVMHARGLDPLH